MYYSERRKANNNKAGDRMRAVVDRFEGEYAVLEMEDGTMANITKTEILGDVMEGDVLYLTEGKYIIDKVETLRRRAEIKKIMDEVWKQL